MSVDPWGKLAHKAAPGFGRMELLLSRLGHPEEGLPVIQVAGSHGKSSVVAFLEAVFQAAGLRVGVCGSPDLPEPGEAVRLQGQPVPSFALTSLLSRALEPWEGLVFGPGKPTVHEALMAVALAHFVQAQTDIVILEASTGQRWDPTNFVRPWLTLLTCLAAGEHTARLAWEAVPLARPGVPLLSTAAEVEALEALARASQRNGAALALVDPADVELLELRWERAVWRSRSDPLALGAFETRFVGPYQAPNLALVCGALAELCGGLPLSSAAMRAGFAQAQLPRRFELVHTQPWIVVDAAQDEAAAQALRNSLNHLPPLSGRKTLVLVHPEESLAQDMEALLRDAFSEVWRPQPGEFPSHLPRVLRRLSEEDFLMIVGPHPVLREVTGAIREMG